MRQLIDAHRSSVRALVARFEFNPSDAEEVASDVFQLAYESLGELSKLETAACRSWLLSTARNLAANGGRRAATRRKALERLRREPLPFVASPEDEFVAQVDGAEQEERARQVRDTLAELDEEQRRLLVMHACGYTGPELARFLGTTDGAARQRLSRARSAFRAAYELRVGATFGKEDQP